MIAYLLLALGLVLVTEGLVYALAPSFVEDLLAALKEMSLEQRRIAGLVAMGVGILVLWGAKSLGA